MKKFFLLTTIFSSLILTYFINYSYGSYLDEVEIEISKFQNEGLEVGEYITRINALPLSYLTVCSRYEKNLDFDTALNCFMTGLQFTSKNHILYPTILRSIGFVYSQKLNFKEAYMYYNKALDYETDDFSLYTTNKLINDLKKLVNLVCINKYGANSNGYFTQNDYSEFECSCNNGYIWNSDMTSCIIETKEEKKEQTIINLPEEIKIKIDNIFNNVKKEISKLNNDQIIEIYNNLNKKIDKLIENKNSNIELLKYLKSLVEIEINNINNEEINLEEIFKNL